MGDATEELSASAGPGIGGLVNVTFGNAPELIIAIFALGKGLQEVVKASLVGSIVGNMPAGDGRGDVRRAASAAAGSASIAPAPHQTSMLMVLPRRWSCPALFELVDGQAPAAAGSVSQVRQATGATSSSCRSPSRWSCPHLLAGLVFSLQHPPGPVQPAGEHEEARTVAAGRSRRSVAVLAGRGRASRR